MSCRATASTRMLFQSGSRMVVIAGAPLAFRTGAHDRGAHGIAELLDVVAEHAGELLRLRIIGRAVAPGAACVEHLGGDALHRHGHTQPCLLYTSDAADEEDSV